MSHFCRNDTNTSERNNFDSRNMIRVILKADPNDFIQFGKRCAQERGER